MTEGRVVCLSCGKTGPWERWVCNFCRSFITHLHSLYAIRPGDEWLSEPHIMGILQPPARLSVYRMLIETGDFPDLRAAVKDMARRTASRRTETLAGMPAALRQRAYLKDVRHWNFIKKTFPPGPCVYCGAPDATGIDHVIPRARGGDVFEWGNLARACRRCNAQKCARTPDQWKAWRLARGQPWPPSWKVVNVRSK